MPKENSYQLLWMLGLAMTLPMILLGGPLAGYLIGYWILVKQLKCPEFVTPALMMLGFAGSAVQTIRLIQKLKANSR